MTTETQNTTLTDQDLFYKCRSVAAYCHERRIIIGKAKTDRMMEEWGKLDNETRNRVRVLFELADQEIAAHNAQVKATITKVKAIRYQMSWWKSTYFNIIDLNKVKHLAEQGFSAWHIYEQLYLQP